jgi:hypothetical protein
MRKARTLEDFRARGPRPHVYWLSGREQLTLAALVLAAGGISLGAAWLAGWDWVWKYGRLTLAVPVLFTTVLFHWWRRRRRLAERPEE